MKAYLHHLKTKNDQDQLDHTFDYPLTLVVAAMGYEKTVAVGIFSRRHKQIMCG